MCSNMVKTSRSQKPLPVGPCPGWRDVHMNTFIHSPVSPLIVGIASYNQFHLAIRYQGTNYQPFQCKGSDMPSTIWSSFIWILSLKRRVVRVMSTEYWSQLDSDIPEVRIKKETEIGQSWDNFQHSVCSFLNFGVWKMISLSFPCSPIETSIIVTLTRCLS